MSDMPLPHDWKKHFVCQMCGNCCAIVGYVKISPKDAERISEYLGIGLEEFRDQYLRREEGVGWGLRDHPGTTQCIMLTEDRLCKIHPVKPKQCRTFPVKWATPDAQSYCEGLQLLADLESDKEDQPAKTP